MKYVISRFNHDIGWLSHYSNDFVLYDRSEVPMEGSIVVPNLGSDISDKLRFIIDNYDSLPDIAVYAKANLFKYVSKEEFDLIKDNKVFTPILTKNHRTYSDERGVVCYYKDGIYYERNDLWFLNAHPGKDNTPKYIGRLMGLLGIWEIQYVPFAPGSNYILPRETILKHPKEFYIKLRSYLDWAIYPGEAMIIERGLYNIWK